MYSLKNLILICLISFLALVCVSIPESEAQSTIQGDPNCDFCLAWASSVIPQIPFNSSSQVVKKVLKKSCEPYNSDSRLRNQCKTYVDHILGKKIVNRMELKNTKYTINQLRMGTTSDIVCLNLRECSPHCCITQNLPEQIQLAIYDDNTLTVTWTTYGSDPGFVQWKLSGQATWTHTSAASTVSTFSDGGWFGYIHEARMTDLLPTSRYTYIVGNDLGWSQPTTFRFANSNSLSMSFAFVADMGLDNCSRPTFNSLLNEALKDDPIHFVIHAGDMAYTVENSHHIDLFHRRIEPLTSVVPYMVAVGNHEKFFDFTNYLQRYHMPYAASGSTDNLWYSWNWGPVHFIAYSSEHDLTKKSAQYQWIKQDLENNQQARSLRPWVVVIGHQMVYCSSDNSGCSNRYRNHLEELFQQYRVNLVLNGHTHSYERTLPVYQERVLGTYENPQAPVYIVNGCGGAHASNDLSCDFDYTWKKQPRWSVARFTIPGYAVIRITGDKLTYQMIGGIDGKVHDTVTIAQRRD